MRKATAQQELALIREAARDESLNDGAVRAIAAGLVEPTADDIHWASKAVLKAREQEDGCPTHGPDQFTACAGCLTEQSHIVDYLQEFVDREQGLHEIRSRGGQHTGHAPSISPSTLKALKRILDGLWP